MYITLAQKMCRLGCTTAPREVCSGLVWRSSYGGCTGWRRLIGCLKSQFIFRKRATNSRTLFV